MKRPMAVNWGKAEKEGGWGVGGRGARKGETGLWGARLGMRGRLLESGLTFGSSISGVEFAGECVSAKDEPDDVDPDDDELDDDEFEPSREGHRKPEFTSRLSLLLLLLAPSDVLDGGIVVDCAQGSA
jgi:hypothetical protein